LDVGAFPTADDLHAWRQLGWRPRDDRGGFGKAFEIRDRAIGDLRFLKQFRSEFVGAAIEGGD
jgi:hypothetical protein